MKTKIRNFKGHFVLALSAILLLVGFANATWVVHTHTSNGTIDTYPVDLTVTGTHYIQGNAPPGNSARIYADVEHDGIIVQSVEAVNGNCQRKSGYLIAYSNTTYLFSSYTSGQTTGTGYGYLCDISSAGSLPSCVLS